MISIAPAVSSRLMCSSVQPRVQRRIDQLGACIGFVQSYTIFPE
jgi:hypothetical protein